MLIVLTESGNTARLVAKYRPKMPILVMTPFPDTARQCQGYLKNCHSLVLGSMIGTESILMRGIEYGKQRGWVRPGDHVVCLHGSKEAKSGSTDMMRVLIAH
jgi:pyruvate kinase